MRRFLAFLGFLSFLFVACVPSDDVACDARKVASVPDETIQVYKMIIHPNVPGPKVGPIVDAAFEWTTVTDGRFTFEVEYADFDTESTPNLGEMRVYLGPDPDPKSNVIGTAVWWSGANGRPFRSQIWIQDDLDPRTHYLTSMHEVGHALGLDHSSSDKSIMYPIITDVGDHPPCLDRKAICKIWDCDPRC